MKHVYAIVVMCLAAQGCGDEFQCHTSDECVLMIVGQSGISRRDS